MQITHQDITNQPVWDLIRCMRFSPQQVGAIRAGAKTMIRQIMKPQPETEHCIMTQAGLMVSAHPIEVKDGLIHARMGSVTTWPNLPYHVGDLVYVPETWRAESIDTDDPMRYAIRIRGASEIDDEIVEFSFVDGNRAETWAKYRNRPECQWLSPYFMPREASRIFLRITKVGIERLQDISETDAVTEGVLWGPNGDLKAHPLEQYQTLWTQKRRPRDGTGADWGNNPWVWVLTFERITREEAVEASLDMKNRL